MIKVLRVKVLIFLIKIIIQSKINIWTHFLIIVPIWLLIIFIIVNNIFLIQIIFIFIFCAFIWRRNLDNLINKRIIIAHFILIIFISIRQFYIDLIQKFVVNFKNALIIFLKSPLNLFKISNLFLNQLVKNIYVFV